MFKSLKRKSMLLTVSVLALGLVAGLVVTGCETEDEVENGVNGEEEPVELTFGHPFPAAHHQQEEVIEPFVEEVENESDGRIQITIHPGGAVTDGASAVEDVIAGTVDMGWTMQGYTAGRFPLTEMIELPFLWESASEATEVLWTMYEESDAMQEEYGEVKVLNLFTTEPGDIYTRETPIQEPADLEDLELRVPSRMVEWTIDELGGDPTSMPMPDVYDATERGTVDGLITGHSAQLSYHLYEVTGYATDNMGLYVSPQVMFMNQETWESLSEEDQQIIENASGKEMALTSAGTYDEQYHGGYEAMEEGGVEIYALSDEEVETFREAASPVVDYYIDRLEDDGLPGQETYDLMMDLMEDVRN